MINWNPTQRKPADELLKHKFINIVEKEPIKVEPIKQEKRKYVRKAKK
jgi:hypothetical protein